MWSREDIAGVAGPTHIARLDRDKVIVLRHADCYLLMRLRSSVPRRCGIRGRLISSWYANSTVVSCSDFDMFSSWKIGCLAQRELGDVTVALSKSCFLTPATITCEMLSRAAFQPLNKKFERFSTSYWTSTVSVVGIIHPKCALPITHLSLVADSASLTAQELRERRDDMHPIRS